MSSVLYTPLHLCLLFYIHIYMRGARGAHKRECARNQRFLFFFNLDINILFFLYSGNEHGPETVKFSVQ